MFVQTLALSHNSLSPSIPCGMAAEEPISAMPKLEQCPNRHAPITGASGRPAFEHLASCLMPVRASKKHGR